MTHWLMPPSSNMREESYPSWTLNAARQAFLERTLVLTCLFAETGRTSSSRVNFDGHRLVVDGEVPQRWAPHANELLRFGQVYARFTKRGGIPWALLQMRDAFVRSARCDVPGGITAGQRAYPGGYVRWAHDSSTKRHVFSVHLPGSGEVAIERWLKPGPLLEVRLWLEREMAESDTPGLRTFRGAFVPTSSFGQPVHQTEIREPQGS